MSTPRKKRPPAPTLSPEQSAFLRNLGDRDQTVRQIMETLGVSSVDLETWLASKVFTRHLDKELARCEQALKLERRLSKGHATETIARVARGQKVGHDTRLSLAAAVKILGDAGRRTRDAAPPPQVTAQGLGHDEPTARALLDLVSPADSGSAPPSDSADVTGAPRPEKAGEK